MAYQEPYHWRLTGIWKDIQIERLRFASEYIKSSDTVLDIGCGDGFMTNALSRICSRIVGVDNSASGLRFARELSVNKVEYVLGDAERLPFEDSSFDVVTAFEVLEHLPEGVVNDAICEIYRVLKSGGIVIVTTPNSRNLMNRLTGKKKTSEKHSKEYSIRELKEILKDFSPMKVSGVYLLIPVPLLTRIKAFRNLLMKLGALFPCFAFTLLYSGQKK